MAIIPSQRARSSTRSGDVFYACGRSKAGALETGFAPVAAIPLIIRICNMLNLTRNAKI